MSKVFGEIMAECTDSKEEITLKRTQEARTELRNRFLRLMSNLYGMYFILIGLTT